MRFSTSKHNSDCAYVVLQRHVLTNNFDIMAQSTMQYMKMRGYVLQTS